MINMLRNYDTTSHKPYPRVTRIEIDYDKDGNVNVSYIEQISVVDGDGKVQHIDASASLHKLDFSKITEPVQIVHPDTGQPIPGMTATQQQVMLSLLAFLRADQLRRDAEA